MCEDDERLHTEDRIVFVVCEKFESRFYLELLLNHFYLRHFLISASQDVAVGKI